MNGKMNMSISQIFQKDGKPTAFVQVVGQNHQIFDYKKRAEWNKTIYAWFAKWLKDQPEWWNAMYPEKSL